MMKGDVIKGMFKPPVGMELTPTQESLVNEELSYRAVWTDPEREGHWIMCPVGQEEIRGRDDDPNTISSAFLIQSAPAIKAVKRQMTTDDLIKLDKRLRHLAQSRDQLAEMLKEQKVVRDRAAVSKHMGEGIKKANPPEEQLGPDFQKTELKAIRDRIDALLRLM